MGTIVVRVHLLQSWNRRPGGQAQRHIAQVITSAGMLEFYLGLCPGSRAGGDTQKFQKDQMNPHAISEYPKSKQQADQVTWKSEFLVSMHTGFSLSYDLFPSQLVAVPREPIQTEPRNQKEPMGVGPLTPPSLRESPPQRTSTLTQGRLGSWISAEPTTEL